MPLISNKDRYPNDTNISSNDYVIGTDGNSGLTKTFQLDDLQSLLDSTGYTRAQMLTLIGNSALKTNVHYRINDAGTDVVGGEPIIVRALNSNTLHAVCVKTTNSASLYSYNISTNVLTEYSVSGVEEAEIDGNKYVRINGQWSLLPIQSDAPADDNEYVRKNGAWTQSTGGGGGVSEAPSDGVTYGRSGVGDGSWNPVYTKTEADSEFDPSGSAAAVQSNLTSHTTNTNIHYADAPSDNKSYIRKNSSWQQQDEPAEDGFIYSRRGATNGGTWVKDPIQGDSPNDGFFYSRKSGAWSKDPIQEDAPSDGSTYGRNNGNYQKIAIQSDAPANGNEYVRKNNAWAISTGGGGVTSDFAARTIPSDSGTVAYNGSVLIVYNNPAFLSDGTTPISSSNIDAEITLKVGSAIGADVPFDAVVDDTRRVITVIPNSDFTKGETYYLTISALKDGDGNVANTPEITFTATFDLFFQSWLDAVNNAGLTAPTTNLNAIETFIMGMYNAGMFNVLKSFHLWEYNELGVNAGLVDFSPLNAVADQIGTVNWTTGGLAPASTGSGALSQYTVADWDVEGKEFSTMFALSTNTLSFTSPFGTYVSPYNYVLVAGSSVRYYLNANQGSRYEMAGGAGTAPQLFTFIQDGLDVARYNNLVRSVRTNENSVPANINARIGFGGAATISNTITQGMGSTGVLSFSGFGRNFEPYWADFVNLYNTYKASI